MKIEKIKITDLVPAEYNPRKISTEEKTKLKNSIDNFGIVEPIFGGLTIILTSLVVPILPYLLSFAAGAMIYVVVEELIPESQVGKHSNLGTLGFAFGFIIMMILDVALG